ncbi:DUF3105 domain-containing protein [Yinghuangia sp. YIM S09857]|uniref:DUF3105 domain-containing protein n=1 Tax=Yinghuangia sp. YIM S09857 TaxID=3436929 RepID=UPI003F52D024
MSRTPRGSSRRRVRVAEAVAAAALFGVFGLTGCGGSSADEFLRDNADDAAATSASGEDGAKGGGNDGDNGAADGGGNPGGSQPKGSGSPDGGSSGEDTDRGPDLDPDSDSDADSGSEDGASGGTITDDAVPDPSISSPIEGVVGYQVERTHESGHIVYDVTPPVGGTHNPRWLNCGIYRTEQDASTAVHAMEHGAVWVTYRPDLPKDQVATLESALGGTFVLLTPYAGLPAPVVASAWGVQLRLDSPSDPRLAQFVDMYRVGPQTPEPGAACTGGLGKPIN